MLSNSDQVPVGSATHWIGGASYETENLLFDMEAYRKDLHGLSEFAPLRFGRRILEDLDLNTLSYTGSGTSEGVEFLAQKNFWQKHRVDHLYPGSRGA